ncbi:DNA polymerase III, alpha chain domain protein, partial [Chlamydia psittaci 01DC11]
LASSYINQFGNSTLSLLIKASALRQFGYNQATLLNEIENNSDLKILANFFKNNPNKISEKEILNYEPDKILETDFLA